MTDGISIRRAGPSDLDLVAPLFDGYRRFYRRKGDLSRVRAFLADRLRNSDSIVFVAEDVGDRRLLGFTQLYPTFSSISLGRALVLNDLFVVEEGRGRGVGRRLVDEAASYGREIGALYLELATETSNSTAQRLYESAGWSRETDFHRYSIALR